jgi:hypothetical protein
MFEGCASNVSPMVGIELTCGEVSVETTSEIPEGDLAVLPVLVEGGSESTLKLTLSAPLQEIVVLGQKLRGEEASESKPEEISEEVLDAIGEVLNLMSGGVDQALRSELGALSGRSLTGWRTNEPGDESFEEGEFLLGRTVLSAPGGDSVHLHLRIPANLFEFAETASKKCVGNVLLLGLDDESQGLLSKALAEAQIEAKVLDPSDPTFANECVPGSSVIFGEKAGLDFCRSFRSAAETWRIPAVLCMQKPTRDQVIEALDNGASHVLLVPCTGVDLLKILKSVQH